MTHAPRRGAAAPPIGRVRGFFPFPAVSLEPATLLAGALGDGLQMEGSGCVFCFVGGPPNQEAIWLMKL